jgi:predicted dehydrogenase
MALTLAECDAMIAAAAAANRVLMVAHVLRFWPEYMAIADLLHRGDLGRPLTATATRLCTPPTWGEWFNHPAWSGGAVLDFHIHDLDALNLLFGAPTRLFSRGQRGAHGGWDAALTVLDYDGVACCAEGNALMPSSYPFTMLLRVLCERGAVEYTLRASGKQVDSADGGGASLMVYRNGDAPARLPVAPGDGYDNECAAFVECVRTGVQPIRGTPAQARLAVQTALAARQSIESGETISLVCYNAPHV